MRAKIVRSNGGPEVFEPTDLELPMPGAGQVRINVAASSVNTADLMARSLGPRGVAQHPGTLAEYLAADARLIAHKPQRLSMVEAAALPLVGITAYEALFDRMGLTAQHTLLIHGGAGGVQVHE